MTFAFGGVHVLVPYELIRGNSLTLCIFQEVREVGIVHHQAIHEGTDGHTAHKHCRGPLPHSSRLKLFADIILIMQHVMMSILLFYVEQVVLILIALVIIYFLSIPCW